jgi:hypothetical protein
MFLSDTPAAVSAPPAATSNRCRNPSSPPTCSAHHSAQHQRPHFRRQHMHTHKPTHSHVHMYQHTHMHTHTDAETNTHTQNTYATRMYARIHVEGHEKAQEVKIDIATLQSYREACAVACETNRRGRPAGLHLAAQHGENGATTHHTHSSNPNQARAVPQ